MARIAYIDHSYHKKTVSTKFIPDLLIERGHTIDFYWDESWQGGRDVRISEVKGYDAVIMFQSYCNLDKSVFFKDCHHNVTYIPMLDQFGVWRGPISCTSEFWKPFQGCKILNFSSAVHGMAVGMGIRSKLFKFYREPAHHLSEKSGLHGFFWVRLEDEVSWELVKKLIGNTHFDSFHLHISKDPGSTEVKLPSEDDVKKYNITITSWFDDKKDFEKVLKHANVFFAPRMEEGIGQSFLEAFTLSQCVVAPNNGTMNEYIQDGFTGLLYDWENPKSLNFDNADVIAKRSYEACSVGYNKWKESEDALVEYLLMSNDSAYENRYNYFSDITNDIKYSFFVRLVLRLKKKWSGVKKKFIFLLRGGFSGV